MTGPGWLSRLIFPPKCVLCGTLLENGEPLCARCRQDTEDLRPWKKLPFADSWTAVWYYEDRVRQSLLKYKFQGCRAYARGYGQLLAEKLGREHPEGFDCLTWVPISRRRKLQRGFDQVELLAEHVGRALDMEPVRLLKKVRHNPPQSGITGYPQRKANVLGVYRAVNPEKIRGKRILVLDDIITTGATLGEVSRILLIAGAKEVHCGAVAAAGHRAKNE